MPFDPRSTADPGYLTPRATPFWQAARATGAGAVSPMVPDDLADPDLGAAAEDDPTVTGPLYWARARVQRPPSTRSRTGITLSPYRAASDEQVSSPEILRNLRMAAPGVVRTANEILDIEGPMPLQRLVTLLARRFGIPRLDPQRRHHLTRVVGPQFRLIDDFAWPNGMKPRTWRGARRVGDPNDRRITDISREELQNAMEFVLGDVEVIPRDRLLTETATLLGYARIPGPMLPWMTVALESGVESGRFVATESGLSLA
ncbi:MAG: hypothetical protein JWR33_481 [Naasia sp.]|jgi:hypothetical protein|uniref:hypothetical protein n=1 Tax=Naasia sp. TaxID=2546198 RepID=UPI00260F8055|nr:hypothetical protein [Naasia sp.]MCU1569740.1 hypothetical protein [Naasia sp.]